MKRLNKIFTYLAAGMAFASCADSVPSEDFGESPACENVGIYFLQEELNSVKLKDVTDTISIVMGRINTGEATTCPLHINMSSEQDGEVQLFTQLDQITFAQGESTDTVKFSVGPLNYGVNYNIDLSLDADVVSPYAKSQMSFNVYCEDPDAWEAFCDSAIFVNNFWSCVLSGSTIQYNNIEIKKYRGKNIFRIYGLPTIFQREWQEYFQMAPNCKQTVTDDEGLEIDCEMYSDPNKPIKKLYMPFQSLGVDLGALDGSSYTVGEVWAGSVAYNLQSASTGDYLTEGQYPLGTYDPANGVFKFGKIAVDMGDDLGIQLCNSEIAIYLDPSKLEVNLYDLLYKNERRGVFKSRAYLNEDGSYVEQGTKIARCVSEDYEDANKTFRITAPYVSGYDLYFVQEGKRVTFPSGQITGSTSLGGYPILCESKTCSYVKTDSTEYYKFPMTFYYVNESGKRYDLGTFDERLDVGSTITYFTPDSLVRDKSIDDYVGKWIGEFVYVQDLNYTVESEVTIEKDDDYTLVIRGLSPYMEAQYGYDSSLYLDWNDETGMFEFVPQYANTYNGYQINALLANLDDPNSYLYDNGKLRVGFTQDGRIAFVNDPENEETVGSELNCIVFYTTASGGSLVEPFIPYNFVLTRAADEAEVPAQLMKADVSTMIPWSTFGSMQKLGRHTVLKTNFSSAREVGGGYKLQKTGFPKFKK